jgi:IclR family KDG regulon transcriptional repressor
LVQTLRRGLDILEYVLQQDHPVGCSEVARALGINISTTSRMLNDLVAYGYLHKTQNYQFVSGMRMVQLASRQLQTMSLVQSAVPQAARLVELLRARVYLSVMWQGSIVQLHQAWWQTDQQAEQGWESVDAPIYATAMGKLLLAYQEPEVRDEIISHLKFQHITPYTITNASVLLQELAKIRKLGYAVNRGESGPANSLAVPVHDKWGHVIAAIGASVPTGPISNSQFESMLNATKEAAATISANLGYQGPLDDRASATQS